MATIEQAKKQHIKNLIATERELETTPERGVLPTQYVGDDGKRMSKLTGKPVRRYRTTSLRAYRRQIDDVIDQMRRGIVPPKQGQAIIAGIQAACEAYLAERKMQIAGVMDVEDEAHPLGQDGGAEPPTEIVQPQTHRISRRKGIGADGNVIDEQEVEVEGGPDVTAGQNLIGYDERDEL